MKTRAVDDQTNRHRTNASALWQLLVQAALLFSLVSAGYAQKIISIDVPGSYSTFALAINSKGQIAGSYQDSPGVFSARHGFLRDEDGTLTLFDVPGAFQTQAGAINSNGEIAGSYYTPSPFLPHGFLRYKDGTIISFDPPGSIDTEPYAINSEGQIAGYYEASVLSGIDPPVLSKNGPGHP